MNLIYDLKQIELFYDEILGELKLFECHFISMSARNKYLNEEERKSVHLNNSSCMFNRTTFTKNDKKFFINKLIQLDAGAPYSLDKESDFIPLKCMMFYANINPSDMRKSVADFKQEISDSEFDIINSFSKGNSPDLSINRFMGLPHALTTSLQKNRGTKNWIDIDCDVEKNTDIEKLFIMIKFQFPDIDFHVIETHGGFHILVRTSTLKFNPNEIIDFLNYNVFPVSKEININKNEMVPIPGTLQAEFQVKMI